MLRATLPKLGDLVFVSVFLGGLSVGQRMLNIDSDLGRHLTLGTYILQSRIVPVTDILSSTMWGKSRPPYEWLAQVILAAVNRVMGLDGIVLLTAATIGLSFLIVFLDARERGGAPLMSLLVTIWAALASSLHWLPRPHVFTFLFLAIWLSLLDAVRRGRLARAAWLPLLMLLWANVHGGFIFGIISWAAYVAGWLVESAAAKQFSAYGKSLLLAGLGALLTSIVTPDLWQNWIALSHNRSLFVLSRTAETVPINLASIGSWPFLVLVALGILLMWRSRAFAVPAHVILFLGLGALGTAMGRNVPLFCIGAVPLLATWSRETLGNGTKFKLAEGRIAELERTLKGGAISIAAMVIAIGAFGYVARTTSHGAFSFEASRFPVGAADWLASHRPQGGMFNDINWGGYLLFRLWPEQRVFIDSQTDFYGETFLKQYTALRDAGEGWNKGLAQYGVRFIVVPSHGRLSAAVGADPAWQLAYQDATAAIYERRGD